MNPWQLHSNKCLYIAKNSEFHVNTVYDRNPFQPFESKHMPAMQTQTYPEVTNLRNHSCMRTEGRK